MSSDLIKRSDVLKALKDSVVEMGGDDFCEMGVHIDDIDAVVNAIPSADLNAEFAEWAKLWFKKELDADRPQGEWIPCEERLPSKNGKYLIVGRQGAVNILPYRDGRWYGRWGVLAWMPLPKPWKGAGDE